MSKMKICKRILKKNPCYVAGRKITVQGLMLHSGGCSQPKASAFLDSWNNENHKNSCVHAFIDGEDGTIYQTLPWNHRGWHCGSSINGSANNTHIGVEMCEPSSIEYLNGCNLIIRDSIAAKEVVERTYQAAVELFAYLCQQYELDPLADGVILSHREGHKRGIASNHGDPEHLWKKLKLPYTMDGFRKNVKQKIAEREQEQFIKAKCPFKVKIERSDLNIRKGAGINFENTGQVTGRGVFTITEIKTGKGATKGWGKLKSGAGWISLDHCVRIESLK